MLLNNRLEYNPEYIDPVREVEEMLINELCPNPDQMTYEQLLEFQEQIGYVEKGFTKKEIEVIKLIIKYSKKYDYILFQNKIYNNFRNLRK